jgi:hypothetical protein
MVRMSLDCDISIWLKYDITTWALHLDTLPNVLCKTAAGKGRWELRTFCVVPGEACRDFND